MIFSMWVDPSVRRTGVGARLIEAAEAWAAAWSARTSVLWVFAGNEPAIRFYHRIGFTVQLEGDDARTGAPYGALAMTRPTRSSAAG
jgi:GNAT superfamily N-acetyltransferase